MRAQLTALVLALSPLTLAGPAMAAEPAAMAKPTLKGGVTGPQLRKMVESLGHKTIDGDNGDTSYFTFEVKLETVNVVVVVEQSGSTEYVWFKSPFRDVTAKDDFRGLLNGNFSIQPAQFYITDDKLLWMAVPVENRAITVEDLERGIDVLVDGVSATTDLWDPQ